MKTKPLKFSEVWPEKMGEWAGRETYFVEKIVTCIDNNDLVSDNEFEKIFTHYQKGSSYLFDHGILSEKLHAIKRGKKYKVGDTIIPISVDADGNEFQFAPEMEIVSVQDIEIKSGRILNVDRFSLFVDSELYGQYIVKSEGTCSRGRYDGVLCDMAKNDGFENFDQFFKYFDKNFQGQILHFTDLRY